VTSVVAIASPKGGVGKSTVAIHVATYATQLFKKVALLDFDEDSRTASEWANLRSQYEPLVVAAWEGEKSPAGLVRMAKKEGFDLVVMDTPPRTEQAVAASKLADLTLVVARPSFPDLRPLQRQVTHLHKPFYALLNACPPPRSNGEIRIVREARELLEGEGIACCPVALSQRSDFSHALISGEAVTEYHGTGKASAEIVELWTWIEEELKK